MCPAHIWGKDVRRTGRGLLLKYGLLQLAQNISCDFNEKSEEEEDGFLK
jgi:hypothetical protein